MAAVSYRASRVASSPATLGQRCGCASGGRASPVFGCRFRPDAVAPSADVFPKKALRKSAAMDSGGGFLFYSSTTKSKLAEATLREQYYSVSAQMLQDTCQRAARGAVA